MNRKAIVIAMVVGGFALQALSYFVLAAPWANPHGPAASNPRLPYAPLFFIIGVMLVFVAALVYELLPEGQDVR